MRVKVLTNEDGTLDIIVEKNRHWENPTATAYGVTQEKYEETMARLVAEVSGEEGV